MKYRLSTLLHATCYAAFALALIAKHAELTREQEKNTDLACKLLHQNRLAEYAAERYGEQHNEWHRATIELRKYENPEMFTDFDPVKWVRRKPR